VKISVVIPLYNEVNTIQKVLEKVNQSLARFKIEKEIIIVDDLSTDGTRELLAKIKKTDYKILYHKKNHGKGRALQTGFHSVTGDIIIIQDADLEYDPDEYPQLINPVLNGKADIVYGSRFIQISPHNKNFSLFTFANLILTYLSNLFSGLNLTDMETCYKIFKADILKKISLRENRFGFEPEFTAKIAHLVRTQRISLVEVSISYHRRTYGEGKKIGFLDALKAVWCIFYYNSTFIAKFVKYIICGAIVAITQMLGILFLVEYCRLQTNLLKNIAHAVSIEISILTGFFLHSKFTWQIVSKSLKKNLIHMLYFHVINFLSFPLRVLLFFSLLNIHGIDYRLSTIISMGIAVLINFPGYNKIVFAEKSPKK
jgi:glycosyltransferase involved in cell wall biosynthesis